MNISLIKGNLYASNINIATYIETISKDLKDNQQKRDNGHYHVTIAHKSELNNELKDGFKEIIIDNKELFIFGLGTISNNEIHYLVVYCEKFNKIRKNLGLKSKPVYHITVGFKFTDIHNVEKDYNTIYKLFKIPLDYVYSIDHLKPLEFIEKSYDYTDDKLLLIRLKKDKYNTASLNILIERENYIGYIIKYYVSKLKNPELLDKAFKLYNKNTKEKYDKDNFVKYLMEEYNTLQMKSNDAKKKHIIFMKNNELILHEMPRNFSWLIENKLGGISALRTDDDLLALKQLGIKRIYYFLEKNEFDHLDKDDIKIEYIHCVNTEIPTLEAMTEVLDNEQFDEPILFGCMGGYGRTGTALACYLTKYGINDVALSSNEAIKYLRTIRPKSIENSLQMNFVRQFSNHLYANKKVNPLCKDIKLIMLVGLPGSGKSTFSELFQSSGINCAIINQDTVGRRACETELLPSIKKYDIVILDRVNSTIAERKKWLELSLLSPKKCLCIYLSTPKSVCLEQIKNRKNHQTIKGSGFRIVDELDKKFEIPSKEEGFDKVIVLEDFEDVRNYLKLWGCTKITIDIQNENFHKFPRTKHLINLGSATRDDLLVPETDKKLYYKEEVEICEKVDGAQLGLSIDENYKIHAQNRSHYVNSKSHSQFKKLDKWIDDHKDGLYTILDKNLILFGEWMYAKHSIKYTQLPDYFLAFDLYDKNKKKFYSRDYLEKLLEQTNIIPVRLIKKGKITEKELLDLLDSKSFYTENKLEGVYIKINKNNYVEKRCKIVRNDFICGNDHWSKKQTEINQIEIK